MIVVKMMGGLGNQMFQYALGKKLSIKNNSELILDLSFLENADLNHSYRKFALDKFNIHAVISNEKFEVTDEFPRIKSLFKRKLILSLIIEPDFYFDKSILNCIDNSYLDGYWQSFRYFESIHEQIQKDFRMTFNLPSQFNIVANKIKNVNSVSIHFRRGDYVLNNEANNYHGVCSMEYYNSAIELIKSKVFNPVFFIFSDDMEWVRKNIDINGDSYFVSDPENSTAHSDLFLMSSCKHAIIANSSFSWWGAWLISNPEKYIIAPKNWFTDLNIHTSDLIPPEWQKI